MRKTKNRITRISPKCRTTSLILALTLILSAASVGFATLASAVVADDDSGGLAATGANSWEMNAPVESASSHDTGKAFWVNATYYDYLSDKEKDTGKWLEPIKAGTGFAESENDWYEFYTFNNEISDAAEAANWTYPLYFGNFCNKVNTYDTYVTTSYESKHDGAYDNAIMRDNNKTLYNYEYYINNSNGLENYNYSITGLAPQTINNGSLDSSDGMPYFDSSWLNTKGIGKIINSSFPFRQDQNGDLTTYSFDSNNANDNVFFNWNGTTPTSVGYGQGKGYGVQDGLKAFMGNEGPGYGIFPFNRASGSNGGNNNLDYGFGIKMNMDFRVPQNGISGTTPITFNYSGDDDLWVYISEYDDSGNLKNGQLVLDLGGSHKKATGSINFSTMKATADNSYHASHNISFRPDKIYIENSQDKHFDNFYVYAWNGSSNKWITPEHEQIDGSWYYTVKAKDVKGMEHFLVANSNNWGSVSMQSANSKELSGYFGNVTYTNNLEWITEKLPSDKKDGTVVKNFGFEAKGSDSNGTTYKTLDPDQTYHMTIFYMERGMIESNCQMSFTMTPVKNDFKVNKTVNVTSVNEGLKSVFTQNKAFDFTTTEGSSLSTGKKYTVGSDSYTVGNDGKYSLKHGQTADFANQHETGSVLLVRETVPSDGLTYTTTWNVVDNNNSANVLSSGTGTATGSFNLVDPRNASARANLQANFVNTPTVAPLSVSKYVEDELGNAIATDDEFTFTIKLNLGAGETAYNLAYTTNTGLSGTATNGVFKLESGETATFPRIPVGATYTVTETPAAGYKATEYTLNGTDHTISGTPSVSSTIASGSNTLEITNQPGTASAIFEVEKEIRSGTTSLPYQSGSLFSFNVQGKGAVTYETGKTSIDASSMSTVINEINGGKGIDDSLSFNHAGVYIFEISELSTVNNGGDNNSTRTHNADFDDNQQKYLAKVNVTANGSLLAAESIDYYRYDGGAVNASSFTADKKVSKVVFTNTVKTGKITVNKKDGAGSPLSGIQFSLYKKTGSTETLVAAKNSGTNGKVEFDNLDIYAHGASYSGIPEYQTYVLKETTTKDGYMKEATVYEFKFPTYDSTAGALKYEYTFDYVNAALKHPDAGFASGSMLPLGIALIFLSFVSVGLYIAKLKKKQLGAQHVNRFIVK